MQLPKLKPGATLSNDVSGAGDLVVGVGLDSENGGIYNYVWGARFGARTFTALPGSTSEHVGACSRDGSVLAGRGDLPEIGQYYMYVGKPDVCNLILDLIATIRAMGIQKGVTNALIAKLEVAKMAIVADNAEQRSDAPNKIEAFIAHVEAQRGKKLDDDQANKLADSAREILFWLGSK